MKFLDIEIINELLKLYTLLGGLPAVIANWLEYQNLTYCQELQNRILTTYRQNFNKYARKQKIEFVEKVFNSTPTQLGNKFKYVNVDRDIQSYPLKQALHLLTKAGICYYCYHSSAQGFPLAANKNENKFKVFFFDIGLAQRILGLELKKWVIQPFAINYLGAIAEQLVAQEIVTYSKNTQPAELYYWHRETRGSNAEVDFLLTKNNDIIPAEIKASTKGGMKSLHMFLKKHSNSPYGIKISESPFNHQDAIKEIPLYGLSAWFKAMENTF